MSTTSGFIGRYQIQRSLGSGGMGAVYLAWDPMIDRFVAIKLVRQGLESQQVLERFNREARSAGRLRHPNIVTIFDVGDHQGEPFIAMEYVQGSTLAELLQESPLALIRRLQIVEDVCCALAHAHDAGIVHRDIKPANVMVDNLGIVKILDFGIARVGPTGFTQGVIGTLNYMAPEQLQGLSIDARVDIFSIGALFYELLSYQRAFPGDVSEGVLIRILTGRPDPLEVVVPGIDPAIAAIVNRCLEKRPQDRYPDCPTLARDIARVRERLQRSDPMLAPTIRNDDLGHLSVSTPGEASTRATVVAPAAIIDTAKTTPHSWLRSLRGTVLGILLGGLVAVLLMKAWSVMRPETAAAPPAAANPRPVGVVPQQETATSPPAAVNRVPEPASGSAPPAHRTAPEAARAPVATNQPAVQPPRIETATGATTNVPPRPTGPPEVDRVLFTDPNGRFSIQFPKDWQWWIVAGAGDPITTFEQPQSKATVVVERFRLKATLSAADITQVFAQIEADVLRENQPMAADVRPSVGRSDRRTFAVVNYTRPAPGGTERVRLYSVPIGTDLLRVTCAASESGFNDYDTAFTAMVDSLTARTELKPPFALPTQGNAFRPNSGLASLSDVRDGPNELGRMTRFVDSTRRFSIEFPKSWQTKIIAGDGEPVPTFMEPSREAAIVVEHFRMKQALQQHEITDVFAQVEVEVLKENQPYVKDVIARVLQIQAPRRLVQIDYRRPGIGEPGKADEERVRQFSQISNRSLYRITCSSPAGQFRKFEAACQWAAESLKSAEELASK
jgi:eukaryotic-like serine/threonine-protein kinase